MNASKSSSNKPIVAILCFALVIAAGVGLFILARPPATEVGPSIDPPEPMNELTQDQAADLMRLAQRANGLLENIELAKADELYTAIAEQAPTESLPWRNQAICRYLLLEQQKIDVAQVQESLDKLLEVEPNAATTYWLLGKTATKAGFAQAEAAVDHFRTAAEKNPNEAVYWYEAYDAARVMPDQEEQTKQLLANAYRLAPNNLFLLGDWLVALAQAEDASMGETLTAARKTFAPLRPTVLKRHNVDVFQLLDAAGDAFDKGEWPVVLRNVRIAMNVTRPNDFTQGDKRSLAPHALEFVAHEFSEAFREKYADLSPPKPLVDLSFTRNGDAAVTGDIRNALLVDFDLDSTLDLAVLHADKLAIYKRSEASGWEAIASVDIEGDFSGLLAADLDRDRDHKVDAVEGSEPAPSTSCFDADSDIVVYGKSGVVFLRNVRGDDGKRSLEVVAQDESIAGVKDVVTAILVDFDHDSNLDVVCSTSGGIKAILGQGDMAFVDVSEFSDLPEADASKPFTSLVAVDWDRDVDIDIVAVAAGHQLGYLENLRHGNFRWQSFGEKFGKLSSAVSIAVLESDANVSWDLIGANASDVTLLTTKTPLAGRVQYKADNAIATVGGEEVLVADFDNNGFQDAIVWSDEHVSMLRAQSNGTFSTAESLGDLSTSVSNCDFGDIDNDGDLDLCVVGPAGVIVLSNEGGNANNWLSIRAMGQVDNAGKANHHGIGSLLEVKAGPHYQAQVVAKPITHFGLGEEPSATIVRFLWTNGVPQDKLDATANQAMCEVMTLKGSCPYVYTWTGERFEFFTDCLWAAPIGLQLAEDVLAPTRSWEYLKIPGERLRPNGGHYDLQVTEELWEAGYFDQVELITVDHPADVEVFSNEKVGPADISEFKLHTVRQRQLPVAARDQRGRDVLPMIETRDGKYLRAFDKTIVPGKAEEHFLELDLGELEAPTQITLFLTGWIYPTDTSLNVALSRHPIAGGPRPPAIYVPDEDGSWKEAQAYMGFPGGKTKTISVDLSDKFLTDDYRLRIVTSAEIYWDEAFFTVDEQEVELRLETLELASAELHYRGFSRALPKKPNAPDTYDYANVRAEPKWPPMRGNFTRYGDVFELVQAADDRSVILGGGDEMTLRFRVPSTEVPAGWKRDFIMHNVGWDKDADLNTIYGQSVEPLPFRDMTEYPYGPAEQFPVTSEHEDYLQQYQTRSQQSQRFWRRIKDYPSDAAN